MLTGTILYKEIEFTFALEVAELNLIPPADKHHAIEFEWKRKSLKKGAYVNADPMFINEDYLVGNCNETGKRIVFFPRKGEWLVFHNHVVIVELEAYLTFNLNADKIDTLEFQCPELNFIYPVNMGTVYQLDSSDQEKSGVIGVETADYEYTSSKDQCFYAFNREITLRYGIARTVNLGVTQTPIVLTSAMVFRFEATDDYSFLLNLYKLSRRFITYLCYRRNIAAPEVSLKALIDEKHRLTVAKIHILNQYEKTEEEAIKKGCYIKQKYLSGKEGQILSDIAKGMLYMRHIPESYRSSGHKDEARFVMITAAFEWEFQRLYPQGIAKSPETIEVESRATKSFKALIEKTTGKEKNIYKQALKHIGDNNLRSEIIQIGKDYEQLTRPFGEYMYLRAGKAFSYQEIGNRISQQRNDFAHGNLDSEFRGPALIDLVFLERIIYIMQLKYYGVDEDNIKRAVNELFRCGLALGTVL